MKKAVSILTAAALLSALTMSVSAADNTTIDQNTSPKTGSTSVRLINEPSYEILIPASIEMSPSELTGQGTITARNVRLDKDVYIQVDIASDDGGFVMKTDKGAELAYTAQGNGSVITDGTVGGEVARFSTVLNANGTAAEQTQTVTFAATAAPGFAGTFTDTVEFTISVNVPMTTGGQPT